MFFLLEGKVLLVQGLKVKQSHKNKWTLVEVAEKNMKKKHLKIASLSSSFR